MTAARMTPTQARALGLDVPAPRPRPQRRALTGLPYSSTCCTCAVHCTTVAAETRHAAETGHARYDVLEWHDCTEAAPDA